MLNVGSLRKSCWSVDEREVLILFSGPGRACVACLRLRFAASLALFNRFSSSEPEANSSETHSSTTLQPSALLSAIRINFRRLRISSLPLQFNMFTLTSQLHSHYTRNCNLYYIPPCRTNIRNFQTQKIPSFLAKYTLCWASSFLFFSFFF